MTKIIKADKLLDDIKRKYQSHYKQCYYQAVHDLYNMVINCIKRQSAENYDKMHPYIIGDYYANYDRDMKMIIPEGDRDITIPEEIKIDIDLPKLPEDTLIITHEDFKKAIKDKEQENGRDNG